MVYRFLSTLFVLFALFFATMAITGCHFNSSYINRDVDKKVGKQFIDKFYKLAKEDNYNAIYKLLSKQFFSLRDTRKIDYVFQTANEKLGPIDSYTVDTCETEAVVGTDSKTNYHFLCDVKRSIFNSKETIIFIKENDSIKILAYHIDSKGFESK